MRCRLASVRNISYTLSCHKKLNRKIVTFKRSWDEISGLFRRGCAGREKE